MFRAVMYLLAYLYGAIGGPIAIAVASRAGAWWGLAALVLWPVAAAVALVAGVAAMTWAGLHFVRKEER